MVRRFNLDGDGQADLVHHGGVDKAVLCYPHEHYEFWASEYSEVEWRAGCFGENLTLAGLCEADVCIGDVFQLGDALLQVSQPRQPCWKLSRRWGIPKQWTIAQANEIMFAKPRRPTEELALLECDVLSASWRETLSKRSERGESDSLQRESERLGDHSD
jgi:MOSC domain-containing protein YiiM